MQNFSKLWLSFILLLFITGRVTLAQNDNFDLQTYKNFLSSNANLTTEQLYSLHSSGIFKGNINSKFSLADYNDSVRIKLKLTNDEISLLENNGFMVTERLKFSNVKLAFSNVYYNDLPVFISTDAILDAVHRSYDKILKDIELGVLIPKLTELLQKMQSQVPLLALEYKSDTNMELKLKDLDLYITVARKLLDETSTPYYSSNAATVSDIISYINSASPQSVALFSETLRAMDFSQFTVRGHYADELQPMLAKYFKAMMWFGRTEIYLSAPRALMPRPTENDIQRQTILASLVLEAVQKSNSMQLYKDINGILQFFVGESDNVTLENMKSLTSELNITQASQLLDTAAFKNFRNTLLTKSYAFQRILSQIIETGFNSPDSIIPASAFMLFGQRFIIDSYVTGQVVFDKIRYNGLNIKRMLPSGQDVLFALGNNASAQILKKELDEYHYGSNLAALRYLVDSYGDEFWNLTIYNMWLNSIRKLNPPEDRTKLPLFMQTASFWQEKMNTQLASWAQLRHDNLLYAKQSYSGTVTCSYPSGYVEPFTDFYKQISSFALRAKEYFAKFAASSSYDKASSVANYFAYLSSVSDTLASISQKELEGAALSEKEKTFIKSVLSYYSVGCGEPKYNGWYLKLIYTSTTLSTEMDYVIADVHTSPTDASGNTVGWVMHVGTGPVNLGVFLVPTGDNNKTLACVGPVMSYYENVTTNFKRLTDQEWSSAFWTNAETYIRPNFTNSYLADNKGALKGQGAMLITSIEDDKGKNKPSLPESMMLWGNYPNPFNASTVIKFTVPYDLSFQRAKLTIYNIQGEVIRELLDENLASGTYLTRWDGMNASGSVVPSGVYFYNLRLGAKSISGKMSLIK
ncbi:MAG: DUF3160 domain-containing protein [Bacteroidota bacterium]|nr:DUF3160 domain-containing protein [Bacteroidota bacterium]